MLARMWNKRNTHALMVGMKSFTGTILVSFIVVALTCPDHCGDCGDLSAGRWHKILFMCVAYFPVVFFYQCGCQVFEILDHLLRLLKQSDCCCFCCPCSISQSHHLQSEKQGNERCFKVAFPPEESRWGWVVDLYLEK